MNERDDTTEKITLEEQTQRLLNVSIKDPEHLKQWLMQTGRTFLIFNAVDLVDSLPWPGGVDALVQIIACYRDHRIALPTGRVRKDVDPTLGKEVEIPICKRELLELEEMDRLVRQLINQLTEQESTWSLEKPLS